MKRYKKYLLTILFLLYPLGILYTQPAVQQQIYSYYLVDRIEGWEPIIEEMKSQQVSLSQGQLADLIGYYYGYVGWMIGEGQKKEAKKVLQDAEDLLDGLLLKYPDDPDLYAFKGAFLGYRISMNSIKAVVLGPESMKHIDHAIEIGPDRPQGWIEKGNALYYMPKMFGGSKEKALESYNKAIRLMEASPYSLNDSWMYLYVLLITGQAYEATGDFPRAKEIYEKTLQFEPRFKTLRDEVYPPLLDKM